MAQAMKNKDTDGSGDAMDGQAAGFRDAAVPADAELDAFYSRLNLDCKSGVSIAKRLEQAVALYYFKAAQIWHKFASQEAPAVLGEQTMRNSGSIAQLIALAKSNSPEVIAEQADLYKLLMLRGRRRDKTTEDPHGKQVYDLAERDFRAAKMGSDDVRAARTLMEKATTLALRAEFTENQLEMIRTAASADKAAGASR